MQNFVLFSYNAINSVRCIMAKKITVVPYDPKWADEFKKIKNELLPVIGDNAISIEHVGSTSVEGLWAKPVIDIDIVIDNENLPVIIKKLADIGYYHKGDMGISGREAFGYNDDEKSHLMKHHLYVCQKDNAELKRHMALRDFLRNNCEYREKYGNIKREMAKKFPNDIESYILGKQPIVMEIYSMCGMNN